MDRRLFFTLLTLFAFSSCSDFILSQYYGIKSIKKLKPEEISASLNDPLLKQFEQNIDYKGYMDSFLPNVTFQTAEGFDSFKTLIQPLGVFYYDSNFKLNAHLINCYAVPQKTYGRLLNWNSDNRLNSFPPVSHHGKVNATLDFNNMVQYIHFYEKNGSIIQTEFKEKEYDYYVILTYCEFMGIQKKNYFQQIMSNLSEAKKKFKICTILVEKDNFIARISQ